MREHTALKKRVGIWIRVSTDVQANGDSPEIHEQRAREYAKFNEWTVAEVYDLAGTSGKSVIHHPECKRMMKDIERGHITGVIFSKLARLCRNRREAEDFADFFQKQRADMISLQEKIDTSTPGGRFFYNLIASMAQWEREEICDRINASFKTRAKLGKLLNRSVPYGYRVIEGKVVIHPDEAPIRREAYELFQLHHRKYAVAQMLNAKGYRTRKGCLWQETQIKDILLDSSAKGVYLFNRQKRTGPWTFELKPESEWGQVECEPIVSPELWQQVNRILEEQVKKWKRPGRLPSQTFSKLVWCTCGGKMYARTDSPKYLCRKCNNKIAIADLEGVFHGEIKHFFANPVRLAKGLSEADENRKQKEALLVTHQQAIEKVRQQMKQTYHLYLEGQLSPQGFGELYKPAEERSNQLLAELPKLQGEVDWMKTKELSARDILAEADSLYERWPKLPLDGRRKIAEALCEKIVIGDGEIDITYTFTPTSEEPCKNLTSL